MFADAKQLLINNKEYYNTRDIKLIEIKFTTHSITQAWNLNNTFLFIYCNYYSFFNIYIYTRAKSFCLILSLKQPNLI